MRRSAVGHADDQWDVVRAGPQAVLLASPRLGRDQADPLSDVKSAHALGPVELVSANRHQIDAEFADLHLELAGGLDRVGVEGDPDAPGRPRPAHGSG